MTLNISQNIHLIIIYLKINDDGCDRDRELLFIRVLIRFFLSLN